MADIKRPGSREWDLKLSHDYCEQVKKIQDSQSAPVLDKSDIMLLQMMQQGLANMAHLAVKSQPFNPFKTQHYGYSRQG